MTGKKTTGNGAAGSALRLIELKILDPRLGDSIPVPHYATDGSAGLDMRACIDAPVTVEPGATELIPTSVPEPRTSRTISPRATVPCTMTLRSMVGAAGSSRE